VVVVDASKLGGAAWIGVPFAVEVLPSAGPGERGLGHGRRRHPGRYGPGKADGGDRSGQPGGWILQVAGWNRGSPAEGTRSTTCRECWETALFVNITDRCWWEISERPRWSGSGEARSRKPPPIRMAGAALAGARVTRQGRGLQRRAVKVSAGVAQKGLPAQAGRSGSCRRWAVGWAARNHPAASGVQVPSLSRIKDGFSWSSRAPFGQGVSGRSTGVQVLRGEAIAQAACRRPLRLGETAYQRPLSHARAPVSPLSGAGVGWCGLYCVVASIWSSVS